MGGDSFLVKELRERECMTKERPVEQDKKSKAAADYVNTTVFTDETGNDEVLIKNMRFMAFCAGWEAAFSIGMEAQSSSVTNIGWMYWVRCDQKLPPLNKIVLVLSGGKPVIHIAARSHDDEINDWNWFYQDVPGCSGPSLVTHWMDLPSLPKDEGMLIRSLNEYKSTYFPKDNNEE